MIDIIFVLGLVIAFYVGYRSGFVRSLVGFIGVFISAFGGYLLYPYVSSFLMGTPLFSLVNQSVLAWVQGYVNQHTNQHELFMRYQAENIEMLCTKMSEGITTVIFNILSIILIILLIKVGIFLLKKLTSFINHIPVIGQLNRIGGLLLSGASYVVACFIIVAVMLLPPANTSELSRNICHQINHSSVVRPVMNYNFFVNYESLSQGL